jgi:hypothetical protein
VFLAKALNFWRAFPLAVTVLPIPWQHVTRVRLPASSARNGEIY